jgi:hypothetical protein
MASFLSEAVEASLCYFFENLLMKLKYPNLRIIQIPSNIISQAYFYLSGPNYFWRFNMRYPVVLLKLNEIIYLLQIINNFEIHMVLRLHLHLDNTHGTCMKNLSKYFCKINWCNLSPNFTPVPSFFYSLSISHILEHELFCLGRFGSSGQ